MTQVFEGRPDSERTSEHEKRETPTTNFKTAINFVMTLFVHFFLQSVFVGGFTLLRTLLLGYVVQSAAHVLSFASFPPALVVVAAFTLLAMLVHPDGLTWIIVRYLRYVSKTEVDSIMVNEMRSPWISSYSIMHSLIFKLTLSCATERVCFWRSGLWVLFGLSWFKNMEQSFLLSSLCLRLPPCLLYCMRCTKHLHQEHQNTSCD